MGACKCGSSLVRQSHDCLASPHAWHEQWLYDYPLWSLPPLVCSGSGQGEYGILCPHFQSEKQKKKNESSEVKL